MCLANIFLIITFKNCYLFFFRAFSSELLHNCDGQLKGEVAQMAAYYEHRLQLGSKAIYHLEAFVAKFMALYKKFMEDGLEGMIF